MRSKVWYEEKVQAILSAEVGENGVKQGATGGNRTVSNFSSTRSQVWLSPNLSTLWDVSAPK